MVVLSGNNLPKRQHELNIQVNEIASKNVPFDEIKGATETSDVDRLFKIDVAAKYRHIDYVIETLKSGDSLYISRVLRKCIWLFDDEYSNIINTDYLHHDVFPFMSIKMRKKLLTSISMHVRNEDRAADFYHYCKKTKLDHFASKFLTFTSELFKLKLVKTNFNEVPQGDPIALKQFLGNSFTLFEAYLECNEENKNKNIRDCSYLYTVSDVKYLDLLERYVQIETKREIHLISHGQSILKKSKNKNIEGVPKVFSLGLKISKDIVVKHKHRIEEHPHLYLRILNLGKLLRHSSIDEVENYAAFLMPNKLSEFWEKLHLLRQIVNVVPEDERYTFAKKIFANKYDDEDFETSKEFYDKKFYTLMTPAEQEAWALQHIECGKEILGSAKDYIWYKFINFDKAFEEVKRNILTTKDIYKRFDLLEVLVESAKSNQDLEKVFHYYYERHVNENEHNKHAFLQHVVAHHDVFKFDDNCWAAFNKILYSTKVNDAEEDPEFKIIAILYYIVNDKAMPNALIQYMDLSMAMKTVKNHIKKFDEETVSKVYDYILKFYLDRIAHFQPHQVTDDKIVKKIKFLLKLMTVLKKTKSDIPGIVMEIVSHNRDSFYKYKRILEGPDTGLTESVLIKCLKTDSKLVLEKLPEIKQIIAGTCDFKMMRLFKKLKVYFSDDIAKEFIKVFNNWLTQDANCSGVVNMAVYGIFQLCDEKDKIIFFNNYVPESSKIKYDEIDTTLLNIQRAICRFACYSRPSVPLSNITLYLKGDYVHFCLPMFNRYLMNLPMPLCLKFVEALVNSPVSIQKHGLRLAFQCFSAENLRTILMGTWRDSKNVSIRSTIYKALYEKTVNEPQKEQCDVLKTFTLELQDTDDDDLFSIFYRHHKFNQLPPGFLGEFVEALWQTINEFKDNEQNISRKTDIIHLMNTYINYMKKETVQLIVSEHIKKGMFDTTVTYKDRMKYDQHLVKFDLVAHYIEYFTSNDSDLNESIEIAKLIVNETFKHWNEAQCDVYVFRILYRNFIARLHKFWWVPVIPGDEDDSLPDTKSFVNALPINEAILADLEKTLPLHEIYLDVWILKIMIAIRRVVKESNIEFLNDHERLAAGNEATTKLGRELGNLVKDASGKHTFFVNFADTISKLVSEGASYIRLYVIGLKIHVTLYDLKLSIARGLVEINIKETNLLALQLLTLQHKQCTNLELYKSVYNTLKENPDLEIQCCMSKKFGGDYKRRHLD